MRMRGHAADIALLVIAVVAALPWILVFQRWQAQPDEESAGVTTVEVTETPSRSPSRTPSPSESATGSDASPSDPTTSSGSATAEPSDPESEEPSEPAFTESSEPAATGPRLDLPTRTKTVYLGDAWTEGVAAEPVTRGFAYLSGGALGWAYEIAPSGSDSGYLANGGVGTFEERLQERDLDREVDLLVIQGGLADLPILAEDPDAPFEEAVEATLAQAQETYPQAELLLLGPVPATEVAPDPLLLEIEAALTRVVEAEPEERAYISPIDEGWFDSRAELRRYIDADAAAPNTAGHAYFASRFVAGVQLLTEP